MLRHHAQLVDYPRRLPNASPTFRMTSFRRSTLSTPAKASSLATYSIANKVATPVTAARHVYMMFAPTPIWCGRKGGRERRTKGIGN